MSKEMILKEKTESRWSSLMHRRLGEGFFVLILSLSLFVLLSLVSYDKSDPGWFGQETFRNTVLNSGGWVGAYLADLLLCLLGGLAYFLPVLAVYLAWIRLYPERYMEMDEEPVHNGIRLLGAFLLIFGASGLASFEFSVPVSLFPHTAGGIIGDVFSRILDIAFNPQGTVLLLTTMFFMGVTLLTGLSWVTTSEKVGFHTLFWINKIILMVYSAFSHIQQNIQKNIQAFFEKRKAKKEAAAEIKNEAVVSGKIPRIDEKAVSLLSASIERAKVTLGINKGIDSEELALKAVNPKVNTRIEPSVEVKSSVEKKHPVPTVPPTSSVAFSHSSLLNKVAPNSLPPLTLLEPAEKSSGKGYTSTQLEGMAREVEQRLLDFGIEVQVVAVHPGPVITRFELQLAAGVKVSRISGLAKDLARSLSVISVRVVDVIPGKPVIGLELPNQYREMVRLSEIFLTDQFQHARSPVSMALGVDIAGYPVVVDLAKMPHLLVAGTTGSGKSVGLNAMLLSILFKATPEEVRLILVDPKMLEFSIYDRIPHLLTPVVTDMKEAAGALRWSVAEMERRYRLMSALGVRNLAAYNTLIKESEQKGEPIKDPLWKATQNMQEVSPFLEALPYIVLVIDELADMMMVVGKKVEQLIARIAQKARAAGIHLILATQRPSVDVLTGLIKSNIPTRIAFQVSSKIDSRTILDQQGADQLLGHGDMLYLTPGSGAPVRIHGAFVDDREVHRVADAWRERGDPQYVDIISKNSYEGGSDGDGFSFSDENIEEADPLYDEAVRFVTETRKASISSVQRRLKVGYNRAARLIEEMERTGVVSAMESNGLRDVLAPAPPEDR